MLTLAGPDANCIHIKWLKWVHSFIHYHYLANMWSYTSRFLCNVVKAEGGRCLTAFTLTGFQTGLEARTTHSARPKASGKFSSSLGEPPHTFQVRSLHYYIHTLLHYITRFQCHWVEKTTTLGRSCFYNIFQQDTCPSRLKTPQTPEAWSSSPVKLFWEQGRLIFPPPAQPNAHL